MLWSSKAVEFSEEDARLYIESANEQLINALGENFFVSTDDPPALVTESEVRKQVESSLCSATTTLDTTVLATELKLPRTAVEAVIGSAIRNTGAFSDGIHVLPAKQIDQIGKSLTSKISKIGDICSQHRITIKAASYIVKSHSDVLSLVGDIVVPNEILAKHITSFEHALAEASTPLEYTSIEPDNTLLTLIKAKLAIPMHEKKFLPKKYIDERTEHASQILNQAGFVAQSVLTDAMDSSKFAKSKDSVVIGSWIVQNKFIEEAVANIGETLQQKFYFDLRDLPLGPDLATYILSQDSKLAKLRGDGKKYPAHYLVRPQLERELLEATSSTILASIPEQVKSVQFENLKGTSTVTEFVDQIKLPELAEVENLIPESKAPSDLKVAQTVWPQIRQSFRAKLQQNLEPLFEIAQMKLEAQIDVYLNAVVDLQAVAGPESELLEMAWSELQQYISDRQFDVPSTLEVAKTQFKSSTNPYVAETRERLLANSLAKLEKYLKSKKKVDAALILHLAVTIYHATHYTPEGLLKIRGKAVPKLLKQYDFPPSFNELRKAIKEPPADLLKTVAEDAQK